MSRRVAFCGAINGTVTVRRGETPEEAISRAEQTLVAVMDRYAKSLGLGDGRGPNLGLEPDE